LAPDLRSIDEIRRRVISELVDLEGEIGVRIAELTV